MNMTLIDRTIYPKFAKYVRYSLPEVAQVKSIRDAFMRYGQLDGPSLKRALAWGSGPDIKITALAGAYGEFTPDIGSNEIRIDTGVVRDFEAGRGVLKTASGKDVYLAGVTLLHEMVHWADDKDGVDYAGEEGELFEIAVYGMVIG